MASMRAIQVPSAGADFEMVERDVPSPGFGEALVRVHACGVCHSDVFAKEGGYPGVSHPLVPGHEIAGAVEALGEGVHGWEVGQRVGVGWFGGNCGYCEWCRRGSLIDCENMEIPGVTIDGGYADHVVVRSSALASMPDDLADLDAAPLLCAGITTYNALRHSGARGGDRVAILGVGGLGHLGVQFAVKLGFETVGDRPRRREAQAGARPRRPPLHRQHGRGSRRGAGRARRRRRDSFTVRARTRWRRCSVACGRRAGWSWSAPRWTRSMSPRRC